MGIDEPADADDLTAEILGSLGGAIVGTIGGPPGIAAGAVAGPIATRLGKRAHAWLVGRQRSRVARIWERAVQRLGERVAAGESVRNDGFLAPDGDGREVIDGVIESASRAFEERKLPILAELLASVALRQDVDRGTANLLVRTVERLSYRQLCLLGAFARASDLPFRQSDYLSEEDEEQEIGASLHGILAEVTELHQLEFAGREDYKDILSFGDVAPALMRPRGVAALLVELAGLDRLPLAELRHEVAQLLD